MKTGKLSNKLRYIICNNNSKYSVNILLLLRVGSINEKKGKFGLAHYFEHMLFKGTKKLKNSKEVTNVIYKLGGEVNAFTTYDVTGYYITINSKYTERIIELLADMFFNSTFVDYKKERDVVISENKKDQTNPKNLCEEHFERIIFTNTPYSHSVGGTNREIKKFNMTDIKRFNKTHYIPENCVLSVSGKIIKGIDKIIKKYFNKKIRVNKPVKYIPVKNFMNIQKKPRYKNIKKNVDQAQIYIGFPSYNDTNKYKKYVLEIINVVLGGNMSSRLFIKLREDNGLVYTVYSDVYSSTDVGNISIYFGTFNTKVKEATKLVLKEIENIKKNGITKEELNQAIEYLIGKGEMNSEDNESNNCDIAYQFMFYNKIKTIKDYKKIYKKITNDDIIEVANEIFNMNKIKQSIVSKN